MIKRESIEKLLEVTDIVDVVGTYINLKRSGRNFVGICPFHDDRNPSMSVNSELGIYHCFSCKAGGDAINFIKEYEHLNFPEAVEKLANIQNFTLEYTNEHNSEQKTDPKVLETVDQYYKFCLYQNKKALNYLYLRGFDDKLIEKFELGFAPESNHTINLLENEKISIKDALDVGIVKQNEGGVYASFIERITFVIKNHTGKLIGFGGRTISDHPAKYVNSPESRVFDKSRVFYAYHIAKESIYKSGEILITEGYMDTIMLHKAGFTNAVAVLGTALTEKHLPLLKRSGARAILCFDGDSAGGNAAIKSARLLMINGIDVSVVIIPDGADPADLVQAGEIDKLERILNKRMEGGEFVIRKIIDEFEIARPLQKQNALDEVRKFTSLLTPIVADSYKNLVARVLSIDIDSFTISNFRQNREKKSNEKVSDALKAKPKKDYGELEVLKTLALNVDFLKIIKESLKRGYFTTHVDFYDAVFSKQRDDAQKALIRELELDDDIASFKSKEELFLAIK
ncbi:MAG: DNA primase, partial [Campylobacter sp.]|nr:DNA primase [Campylobacter sp.]